jgi:hypothetical protein
MTVQELIDKLSKLPPDSVIHFDGYDDDEAEELLDELISDTLPKVHVKTTGFSLLPLNPNLITNGELNA